MNRKPALAFALAALAIAQPASAQGHDHPELSGALSAFHDLLRTDWHSPAGEERNESTCANKDRYVALARSVEAQQVAQRADEWKKSAAALVDASNALAAYCTSASGPNVEAGLTILHERFRDLRNIVRGAAKEHSEAH